MAPEHFSDQRISYLKQGKTNFGDAVTEWSNALSSLKK